MLIKTLALHSLTYIVGITGSLAVHQVIPLPGTAARFQPGSGTTAIITGQIVNRSVKRDKRATPQANDKPPVQVPGQLVPNSKLKTDCKPPIDVLGRCFADALANDKAA